MSRPSDQGGLTGESPSSGSQNLSCFYAMVRLPAVALYFTLILFQIHPKPSPGVKLHHFVSIIPTFTSEPSQLNPLPALEHSMHAGLQDPREPKCVYVLLHLSAISLSQISHLVNHNSLYFTYFHYLLALFLFCTFCLVC